MGRYIYLDNNGTTEMDAEVISFMHQYESLYGNASSMHSLGRNAAAGIDWARGEVAKLIDGDESGVYFTSGATESNNTVFSIFRDLIDDGSSRNRIVLSSVEHPASIETAKYLRKRGYNVDFAPVDH